jgi:hypothetical protein
MTQRRTCEGDDMPALEVQSIRNLIDARVREMDNAFTRAGTQPFRDTARSA